MRSLSEKEANAILVNTALIGIDDNEAIKIRNFIAEVLSRNLESNQLTALMAATPAEINFRRGADVVSFLNALSVKLSEAPFQTN